MNLGVYMETAQMSDDLQGALQAINEGLQARNLSDASIFYDTLGANTLPSKCGWFHSTSINTALTASTVINKFKILLYYSRQDKDLMGLMKVAKDPSTKIICREQEDEKELARLTGRKSSGVVNNFNLEEILEVIKS